MGLWAAIGGRHEAREDCGISHFIEHLLFKGTERRNTKQITEDVEGLGGYVNAFTTEDHTCYYAKAGVAHLGMVCDVLTDMYMNSKLLPVEIERERDVIREEILSYRDQPAQHASELLTETMWPQHPLGRPLTGTLETIAKFQRPQLKEFIDQHYNGRTTIFSVAGPVVHEQVVALVEPVLSRLPAAGSLASPGRECRTVRPSCALHAGYRADAPRHGVPRLRPNGRASLRAQAALRDAGGEYEFAALPEAAGTPRVLLFRADEHGDPGGYRRNPDLARAWTLQNCRSRCG